MKNLGKIFDPQDYGLSYSQSPQTLIFPEFIRIYFSTRRLDSSGKSISYVKYVDFDKEFKHILKVSKHDVLGPGGLGCFDEHGIFPLNIVKVCSDVIFGYTNGISRRSSVAVETGIGFVESYDDGETFERKGNGPILSATINEPFMVGDPFVKYLDDFHMWYIFGKEWKNSPEGTPERIYKIGHTSSHNWYDWGKKEEGIQIIPDKLGPNECQALPSVIYFDNMYRMLFCYRDAFGFREGKENSYKLGYAHSYDLKTWKRDDNWIKLETSDWDSDMQCYPHIFELDGKMYLLYNGNEFGKYGFGLIEL